MIDAVKRRLSAIVSADAVGYSRLMAQDEVVTVQTMESHRKTVCSLIQQHSGRVVDSPGDNILAEFASVVSAVQCAVEIQYVIKAKNTVVPETRRMAFRIGISLEDVIEEGDRIYGDGVNIASRIEGLADAGGICISGRAYDHIASKLALGYEDIGEHTVKNIPVPVRVYRVPMESRASRSPRSSQDGPVPEKPTVAVLAFQNMSSDPEQEFFSDGISEDILNGLARGSGVDVIARTSSFQFKDQNRDIRDIGKQLNASHVLEGSIRKSGDRVRVTAQLINADTGTHVFSEQYDRDLTDVFTIQDEIAHAILQELNIHLLSPVKQEVHAPSMKAYDAFLLARGCVWSGLLDEAVELQKRAVALDPSYAAAYGALAGIHNSYIWWSRYPARSTYPMVREYCDKALSLDPYQKDALYVRAEMRFFGERAYQEALDEMAILARRYPNSVQILMHYSFFFQVLGRDDLTLRIFDRIAALDPLNPTAHMQRGCCLCAEAISQARAGL